MCLLCVCVCVCMFKITYEKALGRVYDIAEYCLLFIVCVCVCVSVCVGVYV